MRASLKPFLKKIESLKLDPEGDAEKRASNRSFILFYFNIHMINKKYTEHNVSH